MPKKNHQNEAVSSTKRSGSGLLNSGGRRGSKIPGSAQPWAADRDLRQAGEVSFCARQPFPTRSESRGDCVRVALKRVRIQTRRKHRIATHTS